MATRRYRKSRKHNRKSRKMRGGKPGKKWTTAIEAAQSTLKKTGSLDAARQSLKTQALSSDVIYEKIEHRDNEHEKLYTSSKVFDIIFYCFYFSFVIIMICTENIKREHFLIYLFVGLIPFIYPFVFKFVHYLIKYVSNDPHGPKNAFVDINNTIISYNE